MLDCILLVYMHGSKGGMLGRQLLVYMWRPFVERDVLWEVQERGVLW